MKNKGLIITLIIVLVILTAAVSTLFILLLNGKSFNFNSFNKIATKEVYNNTFENIPQKVVINVDDADIDIKHSNDEKVSLVMFADDKKNKVDVDYNSTTLNIKIKNKCHAFCFNAKRGKIELSLPSNFENSIYINNDVGDINVDQFAGAYLNVETDVGDVDVKEINNTKIDSDVGDINIGLVNSKLLIDTDTGDVTIDNVAINKDSKITTDVGDIKIKNIDNVNIDAKTDVGNKKIKNNNKNSNITLKLKTDVGDIKVN